MPMTRDQLVKKAISLLQEAGAGQSVDDEDYEVFDDAVDPLLAELSEADIVTVSDPNAIDAAIFLPLARILMNEVGEDFGRPTDPDFRRDCETRIRRVVMPGPLYTTLATDYF